MSDAMSEVLEALSWGPQTAEQIAGLIGCTVIAARQRLRRLRQAGVVAHIGRVPRPGKRTRGAEPTLWAAVPDCGLVSSSRVFVLERQVKALKELLFEEQTKSAQLELTLKTTNQPPTNPRMTP